MEQEKVKEMLCKGEERRSIQMYRSQLLRSEGEERREGNKGGEERQRVMDQTSRRREGERRDERQSRRGTAYHQVAAKL